MEIIVCIKQVPGTTNVKIDTQRGTLIRDGVESIMNPFDEYALEEGVRIKEKYGGRVIAITMGPPQAEAVLREAISRGADEGVLLTDKAFAGADTWATSYTLSEGIKKIGAYDMIICGKQAIDGDTAQVGPSLAEHLNIPHCAYVRKIENIDIENKYIIVHRMMEDGTDVIKMPLPALITVVKEINTPRLPSFKRMVLAKKAQLAVWGQKELRCDVNKIGLKGSPTNVEKVFTPPPRHGGEYIEGTPQEQARKLIEKLKQLQII